MNILSKSFVISLGIFNCIFACAQTSGEKLDLPVKTTTIMSESEVKISDLTRYLLQKNDGYTNESIEQLKENMPRRLAYLDYYYSKSFQIKSGQKYTDEQLMLVNMANFYRFRDSLQAKEIYDEQSHLYLILDSQNTVKQNLNKMMYPEGVPAAIQKFN